MKKETRNSILKYIVGLLIGVGLMYFSLKDVPIGDLKENLRNASYSWVFIGMLVAIVSHFFRALRWVMLLDATDEKARTSTSFAAIMVGYLVNNALPRAGEIVRGTLLSRSEKIPLTKSFATIFIDRAFDMLCLGLLVVIALLLETERLMSFFSNFLERVWNFLSGLDILLVFVGILLLAIIVGGGMIWLMKKGKGALFEKVKKFIQEMIEAILSVRKLKNPALFIAYTFGIWICYILMTYLVFFSMESTADLGFRFALVAFTMGGIGMVIPSPGGIGSYHVAFSWTFGAFASVWSISKSSAMIIGNSLAIIIHTSQLLMMIVVGLICYVFLLFVSEKETELPASEKNL